MFHQTTLSEKKLPLIVRIFAKRLTNFRNSFAGVFRGQFKIKQLLNIPPVHYNKVAGVHGHGEHFERRI